MNIKIQGGGGGVYGNTGSCTGTTKYLEHEDSKQVEQGEKEKFFNQYQNVSRVEVVSQIDSNKGQLLKTDAKYFVITVSPSKEELKAMGKTIKEQSQAMKNYINDNVMPQYAENFNKGLTSKDIMYFAKVHHERGEDKGEGNLHAHIIVSRKDIANKKKLSPQTNHKGTSKGVVKGGFDRSTFFNKCEKAFDEQFKYNRPIEETFDYLNNQKKRRDFEVVLKPLNTAKIDEVKKDPISIDELMRRVDENTKKQEELLKSEAPTRLKEQSIDQINEQKIEKIIPEIEHQPRRGRGR